MLIYKFLLLSTLASTLLVTRACSQSIDTWQSKLQFHIVSAYGPESVVVAGAFAGYLQAIDSPQQWGQGGGAYAERLASTLAYTGVRNGLAFGLDSALHQDPRYYRSTNAGFWLRTRYVLHSTVFTHKDSGGETLATWRFASAYTAALIADEWRPGRSNRVGVGFKDGSTQIGFDLLSNFVTEFGPDVKRKLLHRR